LPARHNACVPCASMDVLSFLKSEHDERKIWDKKMLEEVGTLMEQMKGEHRKGRRAA
jgi:hypothetical protein